MKPIHAKPQSGRAIEPGLVLRIVSKRGRTVMFGQTGLLFANRQWGRCMSETFNGYPIAFNTGPIVIGMHYGTQTDVNVVASSALGSSGLLNCYFVHANHDSDKVSVNWIAIGL